MGMAPTSRMSTTSRSPGWAPSTANGPLSLCTVSSGALRMSSAESSLTMAPSNHSRQSTRNDEPGFTVATGGMSGCQRLWPTFSWSSNVFEESSGNSSSGIMFSFFGFGRGAIRVGEASDAVGSTCSSVRNPNRARGPGSSRPRVRMRSARPPRSAEMRATGSGKAEARSFGAWRWRYISGSPPHRAQIASRRPGRRSRTRCTGTRRWALFPFLRQTVIAQDRSPASQHHSSDGETYALKLEDKQDGVNGSC